MNNLQSTETGSIAIDAKFRDLLPELNLNETEQLEQNILSGAIDPTIIIWQGKNILVDGHATKRICDRHKLKYEIKYRRFSDPESVIEWRIKIHLGRRNLTAQEQAYYRGWFYNSVKNPRGGSKKRQKENTAKEVGAKYQVSERQIRHDQTYYKAVEKIAKNTCLSSQKIIALHLPKKKITDIANNENFELVVQKFEDKQFKFEVKLPKLNIGQLVRIRSDRTDKRLVGHNTSYAVVLRLFSHTADIETWKSKIFTGVALQFLEPVKVARLTATIQPQLLASILLNYSSFDEAIEILLNNGFSAISSEVESA